MFKCRPSQALTGAMIWPTGMPTSCQAPQPASPISTSWHFVSPLNGLDEMVENILVTIVWIYVWTLNSILLDICQLCQYNTKRCFYCSFTADFKISKCESSNFVLLSRLFWPLGTLATSYEYEDCLLHFFAKGHWNFYRKCIEYIDCFI